MASALNQFLLSALVVCSADALSSFRASHDVKSNAMLDSGVGGSAHHSAMDWKWLGAGVGIGAMVAAAVVGGVVAKGQGETPKEVEGEDKVEQTEAEQTEVVEEVDAEDAAAQAAEAALAEKMKDVQGMVTALAQKVADEVGPKFAPGGSIRTMLESRAASFPDKAKNLLVGELNAAAADVVAQIEAPENGMLLEWNKAVETNFPSPPILVAGVFSPTIINLTFINHLLQLLTVALPVFILCVVALAIDWASPCVIPGIFAWLYTQTTLAVLLVVGHAILFAKAAAGKGKLEARAAELNKSQGDDMGSMREALVGNTVLLQEALIIENGIRQCAWNKIVGAATLAYLITAFWNFVIIAGWLCLPVVAFYPEAAKDAPQDYCGAWMTVVVLKINFVLALLYFFVNIGVLVQWTCDIMVDSQIFQNVVLKQARGLDGDGLPIMELLVKSLLFRGGSDTLNARLAIVQNHKDGLEKERAMVACKAASLRKQIEGVEAEEEALNTKAAAEGGDLAAEVAKLAEVDFAVWKEQGDQAIKDAEAKAHEIAEATTKALEELYELIQKSAEQAKDSKYGKLLMEKAEEAKEAAQKAQAALNDPELQKKLKEDMEKAMQEAKATAEKAAAAAQDAGEQAAAAAKDAAEQAQAAAQAASANPGA